MTAVLALDQGTTGSTALVVAADGRLLGRGYREFTQHFPAPGEVEHDADEIFRVTIDAAREAIRQAGVVPQAVGITNQRETTVLWDRNTGAPLHNALVWQDTRTADLVATYARDGGQDRFRERTGLPLATYFSGLKLRWLLDHVPGARAKAAAGDALFGTIDTWLLWNLTGGPAR